ncbi:MAG TPA: VOC family protein [Pseudogracilibacillus sp.]|nr:VOC family protein [Pseudogracilibacillus sp.]
MLYLDHVIWTGQDIEGISAKYGADFQVKSVKGGEHEDWGTFNYLTFFSNSCYMEWLGVRDVNKAKQLDHPLIQHLMYTLEHKQNGPFQFALRTDRMNDYIKHFTEKGIPFKGPFHGHRTQPNGNTLSWKMLFPTYDFTKGETLPFLIEWDQPESERIEVSLINNQAVTNLHFGGITRQRFQEIYNLTPRKMLNTKVLRNVKVTFHEEKHLSIDIA